MNSKFLSWYTQSLGGTLGIVACVYAYLNGYMHIYGNIVKFFDYIGMSGVIGSCFLLPLCIITLLFGVIKSYTEDLSQKNFLGIPLSNINQIVIVSTVVVGFLGARISFIIPTIFILFDNYTQTEAFNNFKDKLLNSKATTIPQGLEKTLVIDEKTCEDKTMSLIEDDKYLKVLKTKETIAIDLLHKNSNKKFIMDITGFSLEEIEHLEKRLKTKAF